MSLLTFFVAAVVLAITPGPGIAYVVARTVSGGRKEGLASCVGTGIGGMFHVLAAAGGLSLLVAQSAVAFNLVKYLGAAYLVYLGVRILLRKEVPSIGQVAPQGTRKAFADGVLVELLNVKTALFFLAFLPQFVDSSEPIAPQLLVLGSICVALNTLVDVVAVFAADRLLHSGVAARLGLGYLRRCPAQPWWALAFSLRLLDGNSRGVRFGPIADIGASQKSAWRLGGLRRRAGSGLAKLEGDTPAPKKDLSKTERHPPHTAENLAALWVAEAAPSSPSDRGLE